MRLQGKVILIMGGTAGLGLSAARAFIREGARLVVVGRNEANVSLATNALGENSIGLTGDATDPKTSDLAVCKAVETFGELHALYHVAGGSGRKLGDGPLHEITDEGWEATFDLNMTSLFYSNRAVVRQFLKQGVGGAVLNISSVLGFSPSPRFFTTHAYAAAKAAVFGLTTASAAYYAPENIRFNALAPSLIQTPMSQRATTNSDIMDFIATKQPLDGGRIGQPSDLDGAAVFLLSDEAKFVTGQTIAVDGGWSVSEGQHSG
jgi:NAD(P)-dependent dehydrogenase (short-subunit alcohol dehydrogenase family)